MAASAPAFRSTSTSTPASAVTSELTRSDSYTEALTLKPIGGAPAQLLLQIHSQLHHAADPARWQLRHQVIVEREALLKLRDAIDAALSPGHASA